MNSEGLYKFTKAVSNSDWIEYGFIALCVMFFVTQILRPSWFFFIGLIFTVFFVYYRIDQKRSTISTENKELKYRMNALNPRPQNFHMDPDLINLFYNISEFREYNTEAYVQSLKSADLMLKTKAELEVGLYHCKENLDLMREKAKESINHLQTVIHKSPIPKATTIKFQRALNALQVLLRRHIDDAVRICQRQYKKRGIDINTHFVYNKGPRPDDPYYDDHFDMYV
jgi:hypothetical protein